MTNYVFVAVMALAALVEFIWYRRERRLRRIEMMRRQVEWSLRSVPLTPDDILDLEIRDAARRA